MTLPEGLTTRAMTLAEVDAVTALVAACELADVGEVEIDRSDIAADWDRPGFDLAEDSTGVFDGDLLVAEAEVPRTRRAEVNVHPEHRGRGIGTWLLAWTEDKARANGMARIGQTVADSNAAAAELFERHGYAYSHTSWLLGIDHDERPAAPRLPQGVVVRDYVAGQDDRAVYQVVEDAFNEWPNREASTFEDWAAITIRPERFEPWHQILAEDEAAGELVGVAFLLDYDGDEGWVQQLATRASHRGRGIARGLLLAAFGAFWDRGKRRCGLSTDSRTGALGLYEHVGMSVTRSYTNRAKDLGPAAR